MDILAGLKETLTITKDLQTLPVLRERLALAQEQLFVAEKKMRDIESENADLLRENRDLRKQLEASKKEAEYLDLGVCCLKVNPSGGYFDTPLCASCKKPFSSFPNSKIACGACGYLISDREVNDAVSKVLTS